MIENNKTNTIYITLVGGAGSGKTTIASLLFAELKLLDKKVDLIPEIVRDKIWENNLDDLNNQYYISKEQYNKYKSRQNKLEYVVSDTSLINGLYYNQYNKNNISDFMKTEIQILEWFKEFNNIVIYVKRGDHYKYDSYGRIHSLEESLEADVQLLNFLNIFNIPFLEFESSTNLKKDIELLARAIVTK